MGRGRGTPVTFSRHPRKTNGSPQEDGSATAPSQADPRRAETPLRGPGNRGRDPQDAAPRGGIQSPRKNPWIEAKSPQKNPLPQPGVPLKEAPTHTRDSLKKRPSRIRRWGSSPAQHGPQGESGGRGRPQGATPGKGKAGSPTRTEDPCPPRGLVWMEEEGETGQGLHQLLLGKDFPQRPRNPAGSLTLKRNLEFERRCWLRRLGGLGLRGGGGRPRVGGLG